MAEPVAPALPLVVAELTMAAAVTVAEEDNRCEIDTENAADGGTVVDAVVAVDWNLFVRVVRTDRCDNIGHRWVRFRRCSDDFPDCTANYSLRWHDFEWDSLSLRPNCVSSLDRHRMEM